MEYDTADRDRLVLENQRLIFSVWHRRAKHVPAIAVLGMDEAVAAGQLGLLRAAEVYDPARGAFSTTAYLWIYQAMQAASGVSGPQIHRHTIAASQLGNGNPDDASCVLEQTPGRESPEPGAEAELRELVAACLGVLREREALVLELRYLSDLSRREVGERLGVSKERVRQIELRALEKARRARCRAEREGGAVTQAEPGSAVVPAESEEPVSETNGSGSAATVPLNNHQKGERVRAVLRQLGPAATMQRLNEELGKEGLSITSGTFSTARQQLFPGAPPAGRGPAKPKAATPATKPAPVATPAPKPAPRPAAVASPNPQPLTPAPVATGELADYRAAVELCVAGGFLRRDKFEQALAFVEQFHKETT